MTSKAFWDGFEKEAARVLMGKELASKLKNVKDLKFTKSLLQHAPAPHAPGKFVAAPQAGTVTRKAIAKVPSEGGSAMTYGPSGQVAIAAPAKGKAAVFKPKKDAVITNNGRAQRVYSPPA